MTSNGTFGIYILRIFVFQSSKNQYKIFKNVIVMKYVGIEFHVDELHQSYPNNLRIITVNLIIHVKNSQRIVTYKD